MIKWKYNDTFKVDWSAIQQSNWECGTYVSVGCENRCKQVSMRLGTSDLVHFAKLRLVCKLLDINENVCMSDTEVVIELRDCLCTYINIWRLLSSNT